MIDNLQLYCVRRNEWTDSLCARATIFHSPKACLRHAFGEWNNLVEHQKPCVYLQICKNGRDKFPNFYLTSIKKNGKILKVIEKDYM